jgi:hypothetical protein
MYILVYRVGYDRHAWFKEIGHMDRHDLSLLGYLKLWKIDKWRIEKYYICIYLFIE